MGIRRYGRERWLVVVPLEGGWVPGAVDGDNGLLLLDADGQWVKGTTRSLPDLLLLADADEAYEVADEAWFSRMVEEA